MSESKCYIVMESGEISDFEWPLIAFSCEAKAEEFINSKGKREFCLRLEEQHAEISSQLRSEIFGEEHPEDNEKLIEVFLDKLGAFEKKLLAENPGKHYNYFVSMRSYRIVEVAYV